MMDRRRRSELDAMANALEIPDPWDAEQLCAEYGSRRGRPIIVDSRPASTGDSIYASVWSTRSADYILVRDDLHGMHRDQAICHELGHLLAEHDGRISVTTSPRMVGHIFNRECGFGEESETEAEYIGFRILERAARSRQRGPGDLERGFGDLLA